MTIDNEDWLKYFNFEMCTIMVITTFDYRLDKQKCKLCYFTLGIYNLWGLFRQELLIMWAVSKNYYYYLI